MRKFNLRKAWTKVWSGSQSQIRRNNEILCQLDIIIMLSRRSKVTRETIQAMITTSQSQTRTPATPAAVNNGSTILATTCSTYRWARTVTATSTTSSRAWLPIVEQLKNQTKKQLCRIIIPYSRKHHKPIRRHRDTRHESKIIIKRGVINNRLISNTF